MMLETFRVYYRQIFCESKAISTTVLRVLRFAKRKMPRRSAAFVIQRFLAVSATTEIRRRIPSGSPTETLRQSFQSLPLESNASAADRKSGDVLRRFGQCLYHHGSPGCTRFQSDRK